MKFSIVDTESAYRRMLAAPDAAAREAIFREELAAPFAGLARFFGMDDPVAALRQWRMSPEQFADDNRARMARALDTLAEADAWNQAAQALEEGRAAFALYAERIPLDEVIFGLYLADLAEMPGAPPERGGYTGFGGIPGWIMTVYGDPNPYNLSKIKGATVHELHHNIMGSVWPGSPMIASVGAYMIGEGLAESFAAELYGPEVVGFYVTDFDMARFEDARRIIGGALDVSGFDRVRGYIFGDLIAGEINLPRTGLPPFAGYAIGYHVVQAYCQRTGKSVVEATFVPAQEIIAESQFFA